MISALGLKVPYHTSLRIFVDFTNHIPLIKQGGIRRTALDCGDCGALQIHDSYLLHFCFFFQNEKSQKERIAPLKSFQSKYVVVVLFDLEALGKTLLINFLFLA